MFVILCYDIGIKRNARVKKIARKYLRPVQKSVCEGFITEGKLRKMCDQLISKIDPDEDSVVIYKLENKDNLLKLGLGQTAHTDDYIL